MSNTVIALKKSAVPSATPASLANGELAINYADGKIFYRAANGTIVSFAQGGPSYGTVNANGTLVVAAVSGDVLTLVPGNNITISADAITDKITISALGGDFSPAFNQANAANVIASAAFDKANSANILAYETGVGANSYADAVGLGANTIAIAAYNKANAANVLAYETGIGANSYASLVGSAANTIAIAAFAKANTGGGATGGGTDKIFWENDQNVTSNYTTTSNKNAGTFGPVKINDGVVVTISEGSTWTVV